MCPCNCAVYFSLAHGLAYCRFFDTTYCPSLVSFLVSVCLFFVHFLQGASAFSETSGICGVETPESTAVKFCMPGVIDDANFGDYWLWGFGMAMGQILLRMVEGNDFTVSVVMQAECCALCEVMTPKVKYSLLLLLWMTLCNAFISAQERWSFWWTASVSFTSWRWTLVCRWNIQSQNVSLASTSSIRWYALPKVL